MASDPEQRLLAPFTYLCRHPGKAIRSRLVNAFQLWLHVPQHQLSIICDVIEMLHAASLLIDDVEDDSTLRRGVPVAHKIYGIPTTINCANYVYFKALEKLDELEKPALTRLFTQELLQLHRGQGMDIYWRDHDVCPSEQEYLEMISNKTGGLLRLAVKLMQSCSPHPKEERFVALVDLLGIHFQIRDDYINLMSQEYADHKGFAEDITEGKFSFPMIHSIAAAGQDTRLREILKRRSTEVEVKKYAIDLMRETKSFEYTRTHLFKIEKEIIALISELGGNDALLNIVHHLAVAYH